MWHRLLMWMHLQGYGLLVVIDWLFHRNNFVLGLLNYISNLLNI